jgi:sulfotransferase 6B1
MQVGSTLTPNLKFGLKQVRWQFRRLAAALIWGPGRLSQSPAVLGNAMPKSGSHLIIQVLQGLPKLGAFVNPGFPPVNRSQDNRKLTQAEILANIQRMRSGDIGYGYIGCEEPFKSALTRPGMASIFVYRDPRDMVISQVFYATEMNQKHGMHQYYTENLHTMEERINAAIQGVEEPGSTLSSIRARWDHYYGWFQTPEILCLRFEDLILNRNAALEALLDYLGLRGFTAQPSRPHALKLLNQAIEPKRSGTFRKGKPGNWREHFTESNKTIFKETSGDLLIRLGYETDNDW